MNQSDQLRLFIEQAPVAIAMFDHEMRYVSVSRRWLTDYNLGEWDLTGLSHYEVFPEITDTWKAIHRRCLAGEVMREDNDRFERADGSVQWLRWEVRPWRDDIGNVGGIIIFSEDITARKHAEESLLESEARFRTLVEEAPEALFVHSDGHVKYVNPAFLDLMGAATPEDLLDRDITLIIPPEYHEAAPNHIKRQKETGMRMPFLEREYLRMDGSRVPVETSTVFIKFQGCDAHLVFVRNISERKEIEGRLLKSEELYRIVSDFTYDWEYWMGTDGRFRYISPSVERITGYSVSDFQEDSGLICRIIHPQDRHRMEAHISAIQDRNVDEQNLEYRIVTKSGEERWLSHVCIPIALADGTYMGRRASNRDITEEKKTESDLKKSEEFYRLLAENASDVIWLFDVATGRFTYVSPSVERLLGYTAEEVVGQTLGQFLPSDAYRSISETLQERIERYQLGDESRKVLTTEVDQLRKDGSLVSTEMVTTLLADEMRQVKMIIGVTRNITERKQMEKEGEKLQGQLLQAQKMESVGRLAGGVAHDFNNMLGVILAHSELAILGIDPSQRLHAHIREIKKAAERSASLTRQLLAFARKQIISPRVIDLNEVVEGTLKMLRRLIGEDIDLAWLPGEISFQVKMDPSQIDQLLANLCVNARDAISGVGKVTIETRNVSLDAEYCATNPGFLPGEYVLLAVSDNGCGMNKETLNKLFEPYFTTKELGKGTGLGLATVYGIVNQNGGFINVYSEQGNGSTFKIYLPRYRGETETLQQEEPTEPVPRGQETILLVEDEPQMLEVTKMMLQNQGYTVLATSRPKEAIRLAKQHKGKIDLLVTDVVMPALSGKDLAKQLLSHYPDLKCLFMSGYTADTIAHHGVLDEGVHFIQKPFSIKDIAVKVREVLGN